MVLNMVIGKNFVQITSNITNPIKDQSTFFIQLCTENQNIFNDSIEWDYNAGNIPNWFTKNKETYTKKAKDALQIWIDKHVLKGKDGDTTIFEAYNGTFYVMGTKERPVMIKANNSTIYAFGNAKIVARDSKVELYDHSRCDALLSTIKAYGHSFANVRTSAVEAFDNSLIYSHNGWIISRENSIVHAYDFSYVEANGSSQVFANDHTIVTANICSNIIACDNALVKVMTTGEVTATGNSNIVVMHKTDKIYLSEQAAALMRPFAMDAFSMDEDVATFKTSDPTKDK